MLQARRVVTAGAGGSPVGDALLSRLYRATPPEIAALAAELPREVRAALAGFCYARAHLRAIGCEIARACDDAALLHFAGGAMGICLIQAKAAPAGEASDAPVKPARARVTLASAADMRRRLPPLESDDAHEDDDAAERA